MGDYTFRALIVTVAVVLAGAIVPMLYQAKRKRHKLAIPTALFVVALLLIAFPLWGPIMRLLPGGTAAAHVEIPSVVLVPEPNRDDPSSLTLFNRGERNFYLCGDKFGDAVLMTDCLIAPKDGYYYLLTNILKPWAQVNLGRDGHSIVPLEMYFMDESRQKKFVGRFRLLIAMDAGVMQVNTQELGVAPENWKAAADR